MSARLGFSPTRFGVVVGLSVLALCHARPALVKLDDKTFEHHTQASTGQTTGVWFVLFTGHDVFVEDWERMGKEYLEIDPSTIFAYVDVVGNPGIKKRFDIRELPHAILFKDRKMFIYNDSWGPEDLEENLKDFASTTYAKSPAMQVPPPPGPMDGLLELWESVKTNGLLEFWEKNKGMVTAAGAGVAVLAVIIGLLSFKTKAKEMDAKKKK